MYYHAVVVKWSDISAVPRAAAVTMHEDDVTSGINWTVAQEFTNPRAAQWWARIFNRVSTRTDPRYLMLSLYQ